MDFWVWVQTVGAVVAGCMVAGVFFYAFVIVYREDRRTGGAFEWKSLPMRVLICWSLPPLFVAAVAYSLR